MHQQKPCHFSGSKTNNFDSLRFLAAALVIFAHSFPLTIGQAAALPFGVEYGAFAVDTFFVISGFLITASFIHSKNPLTFIVSRALRIYPGLIANELIFILNKKLRANGRTFVLMRPLSGVVITFGQ